MPLQKRKETTPNQERKTVSYSRLSEADKCNRKFYYKYITKLKGEETVEEPLIKGSLAHYLVETILNGEEDLLASFMTILPAWIEECQLKACGSVEEMRLGTGIYLPSLADYADQTSDILLKCSAKYQGADAIRTKEGGIPKDPLEYPPKAFQVLYNQLDLPQHRQAIDIAASRLHKDFGHLSLANIAAQALYWAKLFEVPQWISKTVAVEYPLEPEANSHLSPINFNGDKIWTGFIDWIFETDDGKLVIADHKTSKECPTGSDLLWHSQLNLYVALYYEQTGRLADYIGISHLPSGTIALAAVDLVAVRATMDLFEEIQVSLNTLIEAGDERAFSRRHATVYQSPCVRVDYKTKRKTPCPYLHLCHPDYLEDLKRELIS